jgi:DNA transformation protein
MFGLVSAGQIFLKGDDSSTSRFEEAGCRPFVYVKNGKETTMSYWSIPDEALDDSEFLKSWADMAYEAALRSRKPRRRS